MAEEYPRSFGKYTLLRPLARGGMGEIFLAAAGEIGGFEKLCVVKKVLAEHGDQSKAARFVDEAKVVIRLSHGNLVGVFDAGLAEGEFYLAMELVEGRDLGAVWNRCAEKRARFPVDIALYVVREVCRGLAYAHAYGGLQLVHRDVTPPNLLLSYYGEVKLTDFGLARSALKQEFTQPGIVYGRLAYLSPEQAHGRAVDARSDLYSLGIILWELLTGTQLFHVSGADPVTAISVVRKPKIDPPSRRVPRLPPSLDALVMKALAPDPAQRYQSAEEMRRAVAVELAALAPTIDTERVAGFMRMLYGEEIEQERAEREHLLGRDRAGRDAGVNGRVTAPLGRGRSAGQRPHRPPAIAEPASRTATTVPLGRRPGSGESGPTTVAPAPQVVTLAAEPARPAPGAPAAALPGADAVPPALSRIGDVVDGRYRLDAVLGVGAMGTVYEAVHVEIGRCVALKILHPVSSRNAELVQRFRREARAASTIGHPNIVDVTDFGSTADGCAYFVMERLRGQDLKQVLLREHRMRPPRAVEIMVQACQALQAAHERGVIHRDLKPENIFLVSRDGSPDFVKILDFGIAKSLGLGTDEGRNLTMPGIAMGTPAYMAPEQAAGQAVDGRSDIYAVGAIGYELLAGVPPFEGDDILEVLQRKTREDAAPLATRAPDVPAALAAVIMRALRRAPAERPQSMAELAEELRGVGRPRAGAGDSLLGLMVTGPAGGAPAPDGGEASAPGSTQVVAPRMRPLPAPGRTRWGRFVVAGVIVFVAGAAFALGPRVWRARRGAAPRPVAVTAGAPAAAGAPDAGAGLGAVPAAGAGAPAARDAGAPAARGAPAADAGRPAAVVAGPAAPPAAAALSAQEVAHLTESARKAAAAGRYVAPPGDCVRDLLERIERASPQNADAKALRAKVQKSLQKDGETAYRRRRYEQAEAAWRSLRGLDPRDDRAATGLMKTLLTRAELSLRRKKYGAAAADAREALALDGTSPRAHLVLADALLRTGDPTKAAEEYRRVLELKPRSRDAKKGLAAAEKLAVDLPRGSPSARLRASASAPGKPEPAPQKASKKAPRRRGRR